MIPIETDVAVLGGGPAGISAALTAAHHDLAVTLVEAGPVGGDRALLTWRVLEQTVDRHVARGSADRDAVWAQCRAEVARLSLLREERLRLRLADAGVDVVHGRGRFSSGTELTVEGASSVRFERAIIATGGEPKLVWELPASPRLVTPVSLGELQELPERIMVIGGGAAGAELVDSLSRMNGVEVEWVMDEYGMLPRFERELADALGDVLLGRGVRLVHDKAVRRVTADEGHAQVVLEGGSTYDAPLIVLCAGSSPSLEGLGLATLGLDDLRVDENLRTTAEHIWAAGECTGRCQSASHAEAMGRTAGLRAAGAAARPWAPARIPLVVHTHPQLAQVGSTPERLIGRNVLLHTTRTEESLFGLLRGVGESLDEKGFARLVCDSDTGEVLGMSAAGPGAAEAAGAAAIALGLGASDETLAEVHVDVLGPLAGWLAAIR